MMTTILRKRIFDYRGAFEFIQREAIPKGHSWSISYDRQSKDYFVTVIKHYDEEEKSNEDGKIKCK